MPDDFVHPELDKLSPAVRAKVQENLKATLERAIASEATNLGNSPVAAHSRSQGAFFSRSKTSDIARGDDVIVENITSLDDAAFEKFSQRLASIKKLNRPG
jgi:hydrogenase maturation factor HypE